MGKMNDLSITINEIRETANKLTDIADYLSSQFTSKPEVKTVTLEEVRAVLAEKSRSGFTKEVRELLNKHGAAKLSEVNPSEYTALLEEVEGLHHAS